MYGQTGGAAVPALAVLRHSYPTAFGYVEAAARTGEAGGLVRSWLGRTCPPGTAGFGGDDVVVDPDATGDAQSPRARAARSRGRFTRNFVIQATAAEWASTLLAVLRGELAGTDAELVFFQHDEVIVHCPAEQAERVAGAVDRAGRRATALLFGDTAVRFPLDLSVVECYADAT
jgi:DNA polymerase I